MKKSLIVLLALLLSCFISYGQKKSKKDGSGKYRYITMKSHVGSYFYSGKGLVDTGILDDGYGAIDVKFGWQPSSEDHWASMYGYPSYGFGFYSGFLGNSQVFGNPNAIFSFMNFPLSSSLKKSVFSIEPSFGVTYNLNPFDPENNPLNDAIGASMAVYFSIEMGWARQITREMDFTYGFDFTHFSNGRTYAPNYGLNMVGLSLGLKYYYNREQKELSNDVFGTNVVQSRFKRPPSKAKEKINENVLSVYLAAGTVQNDVDAGTDNRYGTFSGVIEYQHIFNTMSGITAGLDLFYDNSLGVDYAEASDRYLIGAHIGYDFRFHKFAIRAQAGTYLTDSRGKNKLFLRPALQYNFTKTFFAQIGLKTNGGADWIEWGIGFKPFRW